MSTGYANGLREILLKRHKMRLSLIDDELKTLKDFPVDELNQKGLQEIYSVAELNKEMDKLLGRYEALYIEMESDLEALDKKATAGPGLETVGATMPDVANKILKDHSRGVN
jgi:hypothetical protein